MNINLTEPLQILNQKAQQAWTGCIEVEELKDNSVSWQIYLLEGKVQYATSTVGKQERLDYLWKQFQANLDYPEVNPEGEYEQLCQWYSKEQSVNLDLKQVLFKLNQEALIQILSNDKISANFTENSYLSNAFTNFYLKELISHSKINSWQKVKSYLNSPFTRLYIEEKSFFSFYKLWKKLCDHPQFAKFANTQKISWLSQQFKQKVCFYQLASQINIDHLLLATYLRPFIEAKIIKILPFDQKTDSSVNQAITSANNQSDLKSEHTQLAHAAEASKRPLVACIDDSKTVQTQVKRSLEAVGYQVVNILDPTAALKVLSKQEPVLILLDINMPAMNGYDLCSMLRRSSKFQEIPIVMLTGRDGIIDRMRAKFVGSTDYLTKPFEPNTLINLIQKLAGANRLDLI